MTVTGTVTVTEEALQNNLKELLSSESIKPNTLAQTVLNAFLEDMKLAKCQADHTKDDVIARLILNGVNLHEEYSSTTVEGDTTILESVVTYRNHLIGLTDSYTKLPDSSNDWADLQVYAVEAVDAWNRVVPPASLATLQHATLTYRRKTL